MEWATWRDFSEVLMHSLSSNVCLPRSVKSQCHSLRGLWCSCTVKKNYGENMTAFVNCPLMRIKLATKNACLGYLKTGRLRS